MNVTTHELQLEALDALSGVDTLCLFVGEDERPLRGLAGLVDWRLCGGLSRLLLNGFFQGAAEDCVLMPSENRLPTFRIFVLGLGRTQPASMDRVRAALTRAAQTLNKAKVSSVALEVPGGEGFEDVERAEALDGLFLPAFEGDRVAVLGEKNFLRLRAK